MSETFPIAFGRYQLVERLAVGGMAELFKARVVGAHGFQKPVVIKKILPHLAADASFVAMFIDEANITARLDHPKIAQVLELGTIEDQLYIAMEYVDGLDVLAVLRACAAKKQHMPAHIAVHIAHEVLDALDYAHHARDESGNPFGIVHRDISPSNILISRRGDVKLADFGIAHAVERQQKTQTGTLKGKYGYMSPEQVVGGELDWRSDIFSVGIVLSEMLMGRRLFTAPNELDVLLMVRDVRLDRLERYGAHIQPELKDLLLRAMAREPKDRFATAAAYRDALAEWLFSTRTRVVAADLAAFVESLQADGALQRAAGEAAGHNNEPPPVRVPVGTLAGPSTKANELRAQEMARLAKESAKTPVAPPPAPVARASASAPAPAAAVAKPATQPAPPPPERKPARAPTSRESPRAVAAPARMTITELPPRPKRIQTEIPIHLDVSEADTPVPVAPIVDEVSGPIITIEGPDADLSALDPSWQPASSPRAGSPPEPRGESDFSDLSLDLALDSTPMADPASGVKTSPRVSQSETSSMPKPSPPRLGIHTDRPDDQGELAQTAPIRVLYKLAVEKANGLLVVEVGAITKEIYFASGQPEFVSSNVARELLGEYLVSQKVISEGELSMALAMMPHFGGKIGDTLVGLGLMKPLDVFRHLTRQVRDKIVDVCTWQKGTFRWYRGKRNPREAFPLGLDAFEVLGAGATALPSDTIDAWIRPLSDRAPIAAKNTRVVPEAFRLGSYPREVYNRLDGRVKIREWLGRYTSEADRLAFLRTLYLLLHTDLAYWA